MAETLTPQALERTFESVKNWGRWGPQDERGALNFITPAARAAAAALVKDGEAVSCSLEFPVAPGPENPTPAQHHMVLGGDAPEGSGIPHLEVSLDYIGIACHGMATSHIDALCHVFVKGRMYNGFPAGDVKSNGAERNSIMAARDGIVGRGVLLDVPRLRGVPWLEPREAIERGELEAAEKAQQLRVGEGDILLVATGRDARRAKLGPWNPNEVGLAGLHPNCIPFLHERRISVLGCDGISDPLPASAIEGWPIPVHQCCLAGMGVHLLDNLQLGRLAEACAARSRWEFLLAVAPLRVERATGSPVNPVAVF
jgi:kynurenine formamidase